ncbi:MAG: DoxX family membrane protein [Bacteroidota bacterium]
MVSLLLLLLGFLIALAITKVKHGEWQLLRAARIGMAVMLFATAVGQWAFPELAQLVPDLPFTKKWPVYALGILETVLGLGLLVPKYQKIAAWALIVFLILMLPPNVTLALKNINYLADSGHQQGLFDLWFRIPVQFCLMLWVYFSTIQREWFINLKLPW